ncbi:site-specific integrase [Polyangium sp. 15x6]|uniref:tyrosine-type recombinase/integrase n=1 Tax=Polyangium sp. 15x6 TaxID=3042687 RepID=UPI002499F164|nr:site-specific integrase [Polyangium sp. 15x6]MDI3289626.1 tyrosine-type recombinase/integrase [Polyangium sp. 15x6]
MSVRKRKDGRWQVSFYYMRGGERMRHREAATGAKNRSEALAYERRRRAELEAGAALQAQASAPLFSDFAQEFLDVYAAANNKPSEIESKRMILDRHLKPFFGHLRLDRVDTQHIDAFKAKQRKAELAHKTINNQLTVLGKLFNVAKEWRRVASVPRIGFLPTAEPEFDFLDFEEATRLAEAAEPNIHPMILLGLRTGLRQGELLELRWTDVDLVKGLLRVRRSIWKAKISTPKGGKGRDVPLSDEARTALRSLPSRFAGGLVFPGKGGRHLTKGECKHPLWRACKRAGLRLIGWHVLRHTFASHLVMRGVPLKAIQELLGHTTMDMTMRYAHLSPEVGRGAVLLLDGPVRDDRSGHDLGTIGVRTAK